VRLHDTLSGATRELPEPPGAVGIYVCGVTPYSESHIGHAMSAIVYDVLVRFLRWRGNAVTFVSNYTDIDDKIIDRARQEGITPGALARRNIDQWEGEQRRLNLTWPDQRPRVTTHIAPIIELIELIIANGHGYATPAGSVYFRVRSKADYGKLSRRSIADLRSGTRFEPGADKEDPLDFALWKAAKPDEPADVRWPSPWGAGRPGWHIECSAMARQYLGDTFDVHGGGIDLVFPHHENEVAQSEAATGAAFARTWMHNGLVLRDGEKMSKSLGNFVTVREALEEKGWSPDALRLFVLSSHYRSPLNLTDEALAAAARGVERLRTALTRDLPSDLPESLVVHGAPQAAADFVRALDDDLGTPGAVAALFGLATGINQAIDAGRSRGLIAQQRQLLRELATEVLGLTLEVTTAADLDTVALAQLAARIDVTCGGKDAETTLVALLQRREDARTSHDFATADAIRNGLTELGIEVVDTADGPRWKAR